MPSPGTRPIVHLLDQQPVTIQTDGAGFVTAAPENAGEVLAVSLRTLHQQNLLRYFPAGHERIRREIAIAANGQPTEPIDTTLYPNDRARVAVTIRFDHAPPADAVWVIERRSD